MKTTLVKPVPMEGLQITCPSCGWTWVLALREKTSRRFAHCKCRKYLEFDVKEDTISKT